MWTCHSLPALLILCTAATPLLASTVAENEAEVSKFLEELNNRLAILYNQKVLANWQNEIQGPNDLIAMLQSEIATNEIMRYIRSINSEVKRFKALPIKNPDIKRQLSLIPEVGYEVLPREDLELLLAVTTNMSEIYRHTRLCSYEKRNQCDMSLVPEVQEVLHKIKDVKVIEYYWLEWRKKTGRAAKEDFRRFVELYRKTAKLNGFSSASNFWYKDLEYNSLVISKMLQNFMLELKPLFEQFHAYIRGQLRTEYGKDLIKPHQPYPQHLAEIFLGNAFRFEEQNQLVDLPFDSIFMPNLTENLWKKGFNNAEANFQNAKRFFQSLGMPEIEDSFWLDSCQVKADLEDDHCWHKAWKFYGLSHVNLSYCPLMTQQTFFNMFESLSDVYYYKAYRNLCTLYQEEPLPNLSESMGKFFSLAASSPKYLKKLGVVGKEYQSKEARLNRLYIQGLRTIFLLPVFYILERYRLDILDKTININNNCAYWRLTEDYSGAAPPVLRSNEDFDAPAKLLMEVDDQYTTQVMSTILQYQLLEHFCTLTGEYVKGDPEKPLDLCDLTSHDVVGETIYPAMSLGSSVTFRQFLKSVVGSEYLSSSGLLEFYRPLYDWLKERNKVLNNEIGWERSGSTRIFASGFQFPLIALLFAFSLLQNVNETVKTDRLICLLCVLLNVINFLLKYVVYF